MPEFLQPSEKNHDTTASAEKRKGKQAAKKKLVSREPKQEKLQKKKTTEGRSKLNDLEGDGKQQRSLLANDRCFSVVH